MLDRKLFKVQLIKCVKERDKCGRNGREREMVDTSLNWTYYKDLNYTNREIISESTQMRGDCEPHKHII